MPIGIVYGAYPDEVKRMHSLRNKLTNAIADFLEISTTSVEIFFSEDRSHETFKGDVVFMLYSKSFFGMSEADEKRLAEVINPILRAGLPHSTYRGGYARRLWETFFIPARSYGIK